MNPAKQAQPEPDNGVPDDIQSMITEEELLKLVPFSRSTLTGCRRTRNSPKASM